MNGGEKNVVPFGGGKENRPVPSLLSSNMTDYNVILPLSGLSGTGDIQFQYLVNHPPFEKEEKRRELLNCLNEIPGL